MNKEMGEVQQLSEDILIAKAQEKDEAAIAEILRRYSKLAKSISHLYFIPGGEREDLEQEALIGLHEAIQSFNPQYNTSFAAFAKLCIKRELITAVKTANRKKHEILNKSSSIDDKGNSSERRSLLELLPTANNNPEEIFLHSEKETHMLDSLYERFSPLEKAVFEKRMEGLSYADIAQELGRSAKAVDNAVHRIRLKAAMVYKVLLSEDEAIK